MFAAWRLKDRYAVVEQESFSLLDRECPSMISEIDILAAAPPNVPGWLAGLLPGAPQWMAVLLGYKTYMMDWLKKVLY